jgi:molybdopterin-guanine dinucleotide biosynthesis protein B
VVSVIAVRVLGDSDAGKTTLIERLVPVLADRGRVATVKSIHHPVELDEEGKDTHRHRMAGAERVIGITPTLTADFKSQGKTDYENDGDALAGLLDDLDGRGYAYAVIEGFAGASPPAIVLGDDTITEEAVLLRADDPGSINIGDLTARIDDLDPWMGDP